MPHEMGDCGREIHLSRTARYGDGWRCYRCGKSWRLVPDGMGSKPGFIVASRPPRPRAQVIIVVRENSVPRPGSGRSRRSRSSGSRPRPGAAESSRGSWAGRRAAP